MLTHKDFKLGQPVVTTQKLLRVKEYKKAFWKPSDLKTPLKGIYIGYRTLCNGNWGYEDGWPLWMGNDHFQAALIVTNPRQKPILVPFSSLLPYLSPAT